MSANSVVAVVSSRAQRAVESAERFSSSVWVQVARDCLKSEYARARAQRVVPRNDWCAQRSDLRRHESAQRVEGRFRQLLCCSCLTRLSADKLSACR